jgi:hypothetical protein
MKSSITVTAAEISNEPRQPNRFEKKKNMVRPPILVPELLVHRRAPTDHRKVFHLEPAVKGYLDDVSLTKQQAFVEGGVPTGRPSQPASPPYLDVVSPAAWPRRAHGSQSSFLEIVVNLAGLAIEVLRDDIRDLAKAGGGRNADVSTQVVKTFEYPQTHACILQLASPL